MGDAIYEGVVLLYDAGHAISAWVRRTEWAVPAGLLLAAVLL